MEKSGIMNYLKTDEEISALRKEWKDLDIKDAFPPFNYDEYNGLEGYKDSIRTLLNGYHEEKVNG